MVFKKGSRGDAVKQIQVALNLKADGIFGSKTEKAVIKFQKDNGLYPDGIVGKKTLAALNINFHGIWDNVNIRFDVVVIYKNEMKLIEHAFEYIQ